MCHEFQFVESSQLFDALICHLTYLDCLSGLWKCLAFVKRKEKKRLEYESSKEKTESKKMRKEEGNMKKHIDEK